MLSKLDEILERKGVTTAAIIDDVFDDTPTAYDIDQESWNFFLDDLSEPEITLIREVSGRSDPESHWEELRNDDQFILLLWGQKEETPVLTALFQSFINRQATGKALLETLRTLLFDELKLQGTTFGSLQPDAGSAAQLIFIDLFLGAHQDEKAKNKAIDRVKRIVDSRRESPPMIVLISSSQRLQGMRDDFRDEAGLFGCQFRTMQKADLNDIAELRELIYRLSLSYSDSLKLSGFVELWRQALQDATKRWLKAVRRLDLRDYADFHNLILEAEGEFIGAYLLEIFGQYFQFEVEEDTRLSSAALELNKMDWKEYPAPHFLPAAISGNIADGMLFRSAKVLSPSEPLQFGDVLLSMRADALVTDPTVQFERGERVALVLLTAACDLQHNNAKRLLFLSGTAKPSELVLHRKPNALLTPVLIHREIHYVIEWELSSPISWTPVEATERLGSGFFERVRRFRPLFSLQLQQLFTSSLSRVGAPVMPPVQHVTGVTISYVDKDGSVHALATAKSSERQAVVLVGRTEREYVDRVTLSPELVCDLRVELRKVDVSILSEKHRESWKHALQTRELFVRMEGEGIPYDRSGFRRSFKGTEYDIITVVGPYSDKEKGVTADRRFKGDHGPLLIELEFPSLGEG